MKNLESQRFFKTYMENMVYFLKVLDRIDSASYNKSIVIIYENIKINRL